MIQKLQEIIIDFQKSPLYTGTWRELEVSVVDKKASVIIGVRRCGKSTKLNQRVSLLISEGIPMENILFVNFFDDRLSGLKQEGLDKVLDAYFLLYPGKKYREKVFCFFDEIQVIPGWESFIDRILRNERCEVWLTGSSAKMLSKEIGSRMRGRALSWELFPFSFSEHLAHQQIAPEIPAASGKRLKIQRAWADYFDQGGFPEVMNLDRHLRIKIHQEYLNSILFRDVIERYDISHPRAVVDLAMRLLENVGSLYTLNGLTQYLHSLGHKVPKGTVADYLLWLEDAYFLFTVRMFDASYRKSNANPKKIYAIDHSFVRSVTSGILVNNGHLLENLVYVTLRRKSSSVYYYRTASNHEIDFLVLDQKRKISLFQVCETIANPVTRQREIVALKNAMKELALPESFLITREGSDQIETPAGIIHVIPVWQFLLLK